MTEENSNDPIDDALTSLENTVAGLESEMKALKAAINRVYDSYCAGDQIDSQEN